MIQNKINYLNKLYDVDILIVVYYIWGSYYEINVGRYGRFEYTAATRSAG